MTLSADSFNRALWWHESREAPVAAAALQGDVEAEVAIIGGGFTGLATALFLAEAGIRPVVVEARHVGFGASGRNGGQVIPGLKHDPNMLAAKYGPELVDFVGGAADLVFETISRHKIECTPLRGGWIQAAHSERALGTIMARAKAWQDRGVPVEILSRDGLAARTGTNAYHGGWLDPRAGSVQPLDYVRGLARAAKAAGAVIYEDTPAQSLTSKASKWEIKVPGGRLLASKVLIATNAYSTELVPGLARSILPVQSMLLATDPLPDELRRKLMPGGVVLSETRKLAFYMRQSADGRLVFGGRGSVGSEESKKLNAKLKTGMVRLYPDLAEFGTEHQWSGHLALTMDGMPHVHLPKPGMHVALGFNGRGIAMATAFGRMIADWISSGREPVFPVTPIQPIAWHALREPVMNLGIHWYWFKDRLGIAS